VIEQIVNFVPLSDDLWCAGMPTEDQMRDVARRGAEAVINLATPDSDRALEDEAALVHSLGMEYASIPVDWDAPTGHDLQKFCDAMERHEGKKILVHCQANYRATAFIALYRVRRLGWHPAKALESVRQVWDPDQYPTWKRFIEDQMNEGPGNQSRGQPTPRR
jgi:protein tyrosine phosphatase (PTP) superfamily phosphohydrolase (DUF442 family)